MQVHFSPEQEARLSEVAAFAGKDTEQFVREAALRVLKLSVSHDISECEYAELIAVGESDGSGI